MEWVTKIMSGVFSSEKIKYERKIETLRDLLDQFEQGSVPMIKVENDRELLVRAEDYLARFRGKVDVRLNSTLLDPIERLVGEIKEAPYFKIQKLSPSACARWFGRTLTKLFKK